MSPKSYIYLAWFVALVSTAGSLFAEAIGYPPCLLCWYQRIVMYPLVAILAVGIIAKDWLYVLPLALIGAGIAFYHNLLQWGIIPERLAPCTLGVSCAEKTVVILNFITIPLLSLGAFLVIAISMLIYRAHVQRS